ncbi:glutamate receptor U1-like isoform X1 [Vespa mandarinia]|uniref:glutamate receptor U1-like isoform X1 n=2 Tax=Vespa mandarinia TaxID=7446 RepID=UPI00161F2BC5|nr:glutamate receptor U1-like isoform X1 [Vespa mandarinia]
MRIYLFLYIILKDLRVSRTSDIIYKFIETSWITKTDFNLALNATFKNSLCCNIYLHDTTLEISHLFKKFIDNYPYEYSLNANIYDCKGYFLLGSTEEEILNDLKKIPSFISSTEILIIVNDYLKINSSVFNVKIYGNAIANVISKSGIWSLSENYLLPRIFHRVDNYEKLKRDDVKVNFYGRQLRASTFYRPPVSYLNRTTVKIIDDVEEEIFDADNELERDGIEMKLFLLMAEKLNFTWIIKKSKDGYGKRYNETVWKGGFVKLLYDNKIDIAFAGIWLNRNNYDFVHLTDPWYQVHIHFLVPRPKPITSFWALTRPFSVTTWILLVLAIFLQSICIFTHAQFNPRYPERFRNFLITFIELTGRLLGSWAPKNMISVKLQLYLWQTMGLILVTAYSSSLAAKLTNSEYENRIDTIKQFLEAKLIWGRKIIPSFTDFIDYEDPYSSQLPNTYKFIKTEEIHENIVKGNLAIIGNFVGSVFFPDDEIYNMDLKNYRMMKEMIGKFYASFVAQPWLISPINGMMLRLRESGIITFHLQDVLRRRAGFNLREVLVEYDGKDGRLRVLTLIPLGAAFFLLLLGLSISTLVFYLELKYKNDSKSIREILRDIDQKRRSYSTTTSKK